MNDSHSPGSVVVGDQAAPRLVDPPVVPDARTEGEQTGANLRVILRAFKELFKLRKQINRTDRAADPEPAPSSD